MPLKLRRIILFTRNMQAMLAFYRDSPRSSACHRRGRFQGILDAGGCRIALHNGASEVGARPPKLVFYADDVTAMRETLIAHGVKLGKVLSQAGLIRCEGKDPDGNPLQISNRK